MSLRQEVFDKLADLIDANYAARDELYAAAATLGDRSRRRVCPSLADFLGGHAAELQQIIASSGGGCGERDNAQFTDLDFLAEQFFLELTQSLSGSKGVLAAVEQREKDLKAKYDQAFESIDDPRAEGVLHRQRKHVEFSQDVRHSMGAGDAGDLPADDRVPHETPHLVDQSLRIVVADDDRTVCNYFKTVLERMGHEVAATAHDGKELVAACRQHAPDLVVADLDMPGNDGIWSAEVLDEEAPVPVIIISGHHEPDMVDLTTAENIHAYLVKPVKPQDLEMAIAVAMRKASGQGGKPAHKDGGDEARQRGQ